MLILTDIRKIVDANQAATHCSGITEGFYRPAYFHAASEGVEKLKALFAQHARGKNIKKIELPIITKKGELKTAELNVTRLKIEGKYYLLGSLRDITEHLLVEQRLHESEARLQQVFDHSSVGIVLVGLDSHFIRANPMAVKIFGYSEKQLRRMTFGDITHPEEIGRDAQKIKEMIEGKMKI
jgi:PAS domain S-box-containing protein